MSKTVLTSGLEDYLEVISNYLKMYKKVRAIDIAKELKVSRASVSEALKRLAEKGFINYGRYGAIEITETGQTAAAAVIEKHTLLQKFFKDILGLEEQEAAENACKIEHVISEKVLERLNQFVKFNEDSPDFIREFHSRIK